MRSAQTGGNPFMMLRRRVTHWADGLRAGLAAGKCDRPRRGRSDRWPRAARRASTAIARCRRELGGTHPSVPGGTSEVARPRARSRGARTSQARPRVGALFGRGPLHARRRAPPGRRRRRFRNGSASSATRLTRTFSGMRRGKRHRPTRQDRARRLRRPRRCATRSFTTSQPRKSRPTTLSPNTRSYPSRPRPGTRRLGDILRTRSLIAAQRSDSTHS
jgi:hypothetical protein